jgi:predicted RNA-binding protein with PIN domain
VVAPGAGPSYPEPTFYLFDGYNLLHAGDFAGPSELENSLSSFVATRGARGVVVFDGVGETRTLGPLEVVYAEEADFVLERLAAELREHERVCLVSSDLTVRGTSGKEVDKRSSQLFLEELKRAERRPQKRMAIEDRLDPETRAKLERLRRGEN